MVIIVNINYFFAGFDFNTGTFPQTLLFSPQETNISVPFSVLQDSIAENDEKFRFFLTLPPGVSGYTVGPIQDTTVTIVDEDGMKLPI